LADDVAEGLGTVFTGQSLVGHELAQSNEKRPLGRAQADLYHAGVAPYRCFLPDLTRFGAPAVQDPDSPQRAGGPFGERQNAGWRGAIPYVVPGTLSGMGVGKDVRRSRPVTQAMPAATKNKTIAESRAGPAETSSIPDDWSVASRSSLLSG